MTAGTPDISVILAVRDAADTIGAQLEALSCQTYDGSWELIVADNGSDDDTVAVVETWTGRIQALRILDASAVPGAYAARNLATGVAQARSFAFCDADDVVASGWLAAIVKGLASWPTVTGPLDLVALNPPEIIGWRRETRWDPLPLWHSFLPGALTSNLGVRRAVFDRLGGFVLARSGSDLDFVWRAQLTGCQLGHVPGAVVHRREPTAWQPYLARSFRYGAHEPLLYREFRASGMPRSSTMRALAQWTGVLIGWPVIAATRWRYAWLDTAAHRAGRLVGSVRARTFYP